jgi:hypothetical protein
MCKIDARWGCPLSDALRNRYWNLSYKLNEDIQWGSLFVDEILDWNFWFILIHFLH